MEECALPIDAIDEILQRVRRMWQTTTGLSDKLYSAAKYRLVPLELVEGIVDLVCRSFVHKRLKGTT